MSQYDLMLDFKLKVGYYDLYFMVQCLYPRQTKYVEGYIAGMGSITLKCNELHYNYIGKVCHYITLQLLYFLNVINYITITLQK